MGLTPCAHRRVWRLALGLVTQSDEYLGNPRDTDSPTLQGFTIRAASIPHVSLVEIDLVAPQKFWNFTLEGDLSTVNRPLEPFNPFRIGRRLSRGFPKDSSDWAA